MQEYPHIIKDLEKWPITEFYKRRDQMVKKLVDDTYEAITENYDDLHTLLSQTIYAEKLRTKTQPFKVDPPKEIDYWKRQEKELSQHYDAEESHAEMQEMVRRVLHRYSEEIHSNFVPKTFLFARKVLTRFFGALYQPFSSKGGMFWGRREALLDKIKIEGPMDHIRELFDKGTVLVLPTHFSNLDSILIGYAIEMLTGMPAFSYGAGLNLYDYEVIAYYMSRLGAYKVDRRKKNPLYAESLRQFSTMSIKEGLNSIFFPGGTRSRYGGLEQSVKMGLLSTLINAQNEFYQKKVNKKIIIVPLVLSYHFVLEADSLIDQHLRNTGKSSYIPKPKPKKTYMKRLRMFNRFMKSDSSVTLSFGEPIDIFGNTLDKDAKSLKNGRVIDIEKYFYAKGELNYDKQRNVVYTRHLADVLVDSYAKENVVLTSHLVSFVAFEMFRKYYAQMDIYTLLNVPEDHFRITLDHFLSQLERMRQHLIHLENDGQLKLSEEVRIWDVKEIMNHGLQNMNSYHLAKPLFIKNESLRTENLRVLYFYHNRLFGYKLDREISVKAAKNARLETTSF